MKYDFLGIENLPKDEQDEKRENFKRKVLEAMNKRKQSEERENDKRAKRKQSKGSKTN